MAANFPTKTMPQDAEKARPILVVGDRRAQRHLLVKTRERRGYSTAEADSGEAAPALCQSVEIEFAISDWMMPACLAARFAK
jgi:sigma-B regulation protein RsbU (phosphoserine phosphatase)